MFFYGHPQNRFWKLISRIFEEEIPNTVEEKKALILRNHVALWDVIASCEISGSSDSSIRNARPTDLSIILNASDIRGIFTNGKTAYSYYQKYQKPLTGRDAVCLPSTSPANAAWGFERLYEEWKCIRDVL